MAKQKTDLNLEMNHPMTFVEIGSTICFPRCKNPEISLVFSRNVTKLEKINSYLDSVGIVFCHLTVLVYH